MHIGIWKIETEFYISLMHRKHERIFNKDINTFRNVMEWRISDSVDTGNAHGMRNFGYKQKHADKLTPIWGIKNAS